MVGPNVAARRCITPAISALLVAALAIPAVAAVTFDPATGTGFVGKGVQFHATATEVTEVSWTCTNSNNENTQERARTTTATTQGVVSSIARERNQVTGFNITGYSGTPAASSETEGPRVNTCPSGPWTLTTPAGDPVVVSSASTLEVSIDGTSWSILQ